MADFFIATGIILIMLCGWLTVQHLARQFARRHPEHGPAKEEGSGCGASCLCKNKEHCQNKQAINKQLINKKAINNHPTLKLPNITGG